MNCKNRGDRIARMHERDQFNRFFMPLTYGVSLIGLLLLGWVGLMRIDGEPWNKETLAVGKLLVFAPAPVWVFRIFRGHYSSKLKD